MSTKRAHRAIISTNLATLTDHNQGSHGGDLAEAFPISGQIDPKSFPFLVVELHRRGATGSLKVEGPSYHKAVYFRSGRVLFGSSNDPRDQLGAILIESAKITPEQLADVNAKVGPGNPLAKVLSDTGFVSQRELSDAARAKVERILSDVLAYTGGTFDFEDGVLPKGAVDLKLATERLVMAAVRRVTDRNFVLRHIDGLDAILGPTADMVPRLGEIETETGGLPQHLDGRRTLKEAAASARLEEFEAAKIACGLLFLGLVERVPAVVTASAATAVTFADVDSGDELDLGATAAQAFTPDPPIVVPTVDPEPVVMPAVTSEPPPFVLSEPSAAPALGSMPLESSEITFETAPRIAITPEPAPVEPEPEPEPVHASVEPPPPASVEAPAMEAVPVSVEPEPPAPQPGPAVTPSRSTAPPPTDASPFPVTSADSPLPLVMPDRAGSAASRSTGRRSEPGSSTRPSRPSKEDLAALDDLLNSRSLEGPLTPLDKPSGADQPQYARSGGRRARSSRAPLLLGAAGVLLGVAAGAWFYWSRMPGRAAGTASTTASPSPLARATVPPAPADVSAASPIPPPAGAPSAAAGAVPGTATPVAATTDSRPAPPTTAKPTAAPVAAATARPPAISTAPPDARALLRAGNYPDAARAFATSARAAGKGAAVIQLFVACSGETVQKAVDNAGGTELLILPVNFKGRDCYRLGWGLYPSQARAAAALRAVPEYFRTGGAAPKVLAVSEALP